LHPATSLTFARRIALIGTFACFATAFAAEPKPDAAVKNSNIEASVLLDDKIKADPALASDCLAEGKKWMDKNAAEAAARPDGHLDYLRRYCCPRGCTRV
jgi:hypothetical protein